MTANAFFSALAASSLFSHLSEAEGKRLSEHALLSSFSQSDDISDKSMGMLSLIVSGRANVFSHDGKRETLLRIMSPGDVFGVAGLFTGVSEVSRIIASTKGSIARIPKDEILELLSENREFAESYIVFLERRIVFLNRRISAFTAGSSERRLATFLASVSQEESYEVRGIPFSSLAKQLDMGRASFYRALETLSADGSITHSKKLISVSSRTDLLKKYIKITEDKTK